REVTFHFSVEQILQIHEAQIEKFGGAPGLRDPGALESAVARPAMTFGGEDLYPDVPSKAAALMHSLVMNHAFVDGNKRVGVTSADLLLRLNGYRLHASDPELGELTLTVARGELDAEALAIWFRQRISREDRGGALLDRRVRPVGRHRRRGDHQLPGVPALFRAGGGGAAPVRRAPLPLPVRISRDLAAARARRVQLLPAGQARRAPGGRGVLQPDRPHVDP